MWFRGDDVTLNGGTVSQWNDKSGKGNHIVQATAANQPTYLATGGPNSQPCVQGDGTNDQLLLASGCTIAAQSMTWWIVVMNETSWALEVPLSGGLDASTDSFGLILRTAPDEWDWSTYNPTTRIELTESVSVGAWYVTRVTFNRSGGAMTMKVHNGTPGTNTNGGSGRNTTLLSLFTNRAKTAYFSGRIAEAICKSGISVSGENAQVNQYLNDRYPSLALLT